MQEDFLLKKLDERRSQQALRQLRLFSSPMADFCSNDYLGIIKNNLLSPEISNSSAQHGSSGSRLLSGNYLFIEETEKKIASFHDAEAALIFNSGYDANLGLLSAVPQRTDTVIYDYLCHASLRDGVRLSAARSFSFRHNEMDDLEKKLNEASGNIFIVTESVFSMDGDSAPLDDIVTLCERFGAHLIIDEAHATGVVGRMGEGLVQQKNIQHKCFARIHTFGKGCGAHGAVVLGSKTLISYLINFSRPFIYTTALPPAAIAAIAAAYEVFPNLHAERKTLQERIAQFSNAELKYNKLKSQTPIQAVLIPGNEEVKKVAAYLQQHALDVRPILYPSVPKGGERLRVVLHAYNTVEEVARLARNLS